MIKNKLLFWEMNPITVLNSTSTERVRYALLQFDDADLLIDHFSELQQELEAEDIELLYLKTENQIITVENIDPTLLTQLEEFRKIKFDDFTGLVVIVNNFTGINNTIYILKHLEDCFDHVSLQLQEIEIFLLINDIKLIHCQVSVNDI